MSMWAPAPFRIAFDNARDPYTARNALGITDSGGGTPGPAGPPGPTGPAGPAGPTGPAGIVTANPPLSLTGSTLSIDLSGYQPLDADLTSLAAASVTDAIYYRSAANTWATVTIGTGLTFTGGTLNASGGGGGITQADADLRYVNISGDTMTGVLQMPAGSNALPSIIFTSGTPYTGISGSGTFVSFSTGGIQKFLVGGTDCQFFNRIYATAGAVNAAAIHFGTSNTGFYGGADIRATVSGSNKLTLNGTDLTTTVPVTLPADPTLALQAATKQYVDAFGQFDCGVLAYVSATQLSFTPFKGDRIRIAGVTYAIPSAGIAALTNGSLAANTLYYVYAFNSAGTITGEFSATAHATSTTAGNVGTEIKSGDNTRTLIGMVRTNASSQFVNSAAQRFVRTWFNDHGISGNKQFAANRTTASTSNVELSSVERIEFLTWANEVVLASSGGQATNNTLGQISYFQIGFDGSVFAGTGAQHAVANYSVALSARWADDTLAEGYHYQQSYGAVTSGTATYNAGWTMSLHSNGAGR